MSSILTLNGNVLTSSGSALNAELTNLQIESGKTYTVSTGGTQTISPTSGYGAMDSVILSVPSIAAATYTPTTSNQTIAAGNWISGVQTILGDSNLVSGNIKEGVSIFGVPGSHKGGSGIASGTFTTSSSYGTQNVTVSYSGSGYPVACLVFVTGGPYNNGTGGNSSWYNLVQRYAVGVWGMVKSRANVAPTYSTSGEANYGTTWAVYKNSNSSATTYTASAAMNTNTFTASSSSASASAAQTVRFKGSGTAMQVYVSDTSYGLARSTNYTYYIVYSS